MFKMLQYTITFIIDKFSCIIYNISTFLFVILLIILF